jgi:hypothetical protein
MVVPRGVKGVLGPAKGHGGRARGDGTREPETGNREPRLRTEALFPVPAAAPAARRLPVPAIPDSLFPIPDLFRR